ncbi:four helix bundle protein [candidate division WOR-3 bacterium]|jgi:four helix bundle protein|nr:four helix bundle protein [candidate division WOR-3 bacterium]MCK4673438.1 four helix bundle protein [candidate division WOR-3 bacterium]
MKIVQGYKKLKVYNLAHELAIRVHTMSLKLPRFELFEEGGQIRRSSKSISSNIVEGYALRRYKQEYIHYLMNAYASSMETVEHLDYLFETKSLKDNDLYKSLLNRYIELNSMLYNFIEAIESKHDPARVGKINQ